MQAKRLILFLILFLPISCKTTGSQVKADQSDRTILVDALVSMGIDNLSREEMDKFADYLLEKTRPQEPTNTQLDPRNNYAKAFIAYRQSGNSNQAEIQDWLTAGLAAYSNYIEMEITGEPFQIRDPYSVGE